MKASLSFIALCQVAAVVLATSVHAAAVDVEKRGAYVQTPICDRGDSHCIYMTNAYTYGPSEPNVRCSSVDRLGRGTGACQLPDATMAYVNCNGDPSSYVRVQFGQHSSFTTHGRATAQWSSQRRANDDSYGGRDAYSNNYPKYSTDEAGDDLYVQC